MLSERNIQFQAAKCSAHLVTGAESSACALACGPVTYHQSLHARHYEHRLVFLAGNDKTRFSVYKNYSAFRGTIRITVVIDQC